MTAVLFYTGPSLRDLHEDYAKKHRSAFGAKVVHRYVLEASPGGGTRVVVEESMAGPLLAVFFYTSGKLQGLLETCLATLKTAVETAR